MPAMSEVPKSRLRLGPLAWLGLALLGFFGLLLGGYALYRYILSSKVERALADLSAAGLPVTGAAAHWPEQVGGRN